MIGRRRRWGPRAYGRSIGEWLVGQHEIVTQGSRWMGVPALKWPLDAWIYQEIIHETRPEVIIELGSEYGGGALFLAHMLELTGQGQVVSVDVDHDRFQAEHPRIALVTGDTHDPATLAAVQDRCAGRSTMVIHDASHVGAAVLADLRSFGPLVTPGNYLIVEDGIADQVPARLGGLAGPGPLWATDQFLREAPEFERDTERERYVATYNPGGYLRRRE